MTKTQTEKKKTPRSRAVGRTKEAIAAYSKGLELMPNRSLSLLGLARAQRVVGDAAAAAKTEAQLRENWRRADARATSRLASIR